MHDLFNPPPVNQESFWTSSVHKKERDAYGQAHLDKHRKKFGGQNKRVYDSLQTGAELDDDIVRAWTPEIRHLHSRAPDLKKVGFKISTKPHPTKNLTIYYCTPEQIEYNKILMEQIQPGKQ